MFGSPSPSRSGIWATVLVSACQALSSRPHSLVVEVHRPLDEDRLLVKAFHLCAEVVGGVVSLPKRVFHPNGVARVLWNKEQLVFARAVALSIGEPQVGILIIGVLDAEIGFEVRAAGSLREIEFLSKIRCPHRVVPPGPDTIV